MIRNALLENCDWQCYLDRYPDLQTAFGDDLAAAETHWNSHGKGGSRFCACNAPIGNCDWQCYLDRYPDLKDAFGDDLVAAESHWNIHGKNEGRDCSCGNLPVSSMSILFQNVIGPLVPIPKIYIDRYLRLV